jgi:hypothetical protein
LLDETLEKTFSIYGMKKRKKVIRASCKNPSET